MVALYLTKMQTVFNDNIQRRQQLYENVSFWRVFYWYV